MDQHGGVTEPRNPVDQALDLFLYAPLGFLLEARRLVPELVERGHQQVNNQLTMAKMMGRFAVQQGQSQASKRFDLMQRQASGALANLGLGDRSGSPVTTNGATPSAPTNAPTPTAASTPSSPASPDSAILTPAGPTPTGPDPLLGATDALVADDAALAVPDYDSLAASQVIPRLAGLSPFELEAVRAHEVARRGRKTILNRIAQLQAG